MDFAEIKKLFKQLFTNLSENIEATPKRFWMWWESVSALEMISFAVSLILLFIVLLVAGIAKLADGISKAEKEANTKQSSPTPTNRSVPANITTNINQSGYSNSNSYSNGNYYDANRAMNSNYGGNSYAAPTPAPSMSNSYLTNKNMSRNTPDTSAPSRFNWQVIKLRATIYSSPSTGSNVVGTVDKGDRLINFYRENDLSKWYFITTENGIEGWIDGNDIEQVSPTQIF